MRCTVLHRLVWVVNNFRMELAVEIGKKGNGLIESIKTFFSNAILRILGCHPLNIPFQERRYFPPNRILLSHSTGRIGFNSITKKKGRRWTIIWNIIIKPRLHK